MLGGVKNYKTKLCYCLRCTFAFYDYRITEEENFHIYNNYRDESYQKLRERYEYWYTEKVNTALNDDVNVLREQQRVIESIIEKNISRELREALDYGGNEGKTFTDRIGTRGKFVFDISGVKTIDGVNGISDFEELKQHSFDFIMCNMVFEHVSYPLEILKNLKEIGDEDTLYYIEVPDENPFIKGNKFSIWKNWPLIFNRNLSIVHLIKSYFKQLKDPFMPMKEHINFFTEKRSNRMGCSIICFV